MAVGIWLVYWLPFFSFPLMAPPGVIDAVSTLLLLTWERKVV